MSRKDIHFAFVMNEVLGPYGTIRVLQTIKAFAITENSLGLKKDIIISGSSKNLYEFFALRRWIVSESGQISVKIRSIPLLKGPSLGQQYLLSVTTLGQSSLILTAVKQSAKLAAAASMLSGSVYELRLSASATTKQSAFSTIDLMIEASSISGVAFAEALKHWVKKQSNKSHQIKSLFRYSSHPYYVEQGGTLAGYGANVAKSASPIVTGEEDELYGG